MTEPQTEDKQIGQYCTQIQPSLLFEFITYASSGKLEELKALVEKHDMDVNQGDYDKRTALHLASEEGHEDIVDYLLAKNCDVNVIDRWGATPLRGALHYGHNSIACKLKDKGGITLFDQISNGRSSIEVTREINATSKILTEASILTFQNITNGEKKMTVSHLDKFLRSKGLNMKRHHLLKDLVVKLFDGSEYVTARQFLLYANGNSDILARAFKGKLAIDNWEAFCKEVYEIYQIVKKNTSGENASYIPELKDVDPNFFGVSITTVDGQVLDIGDTTIGFSIQSCVKPLMYSFAVEELGYDYVHRFVGKEPSGVAFNAFTLNSENKPHNSCINAGAIVVAAAYHPKWKIAEKFKNVIKNISGLAGGAKIGFDQAVYLSERETAYNNKALAYFLSSKNGFPEGSGVQESLDFYFQLCSIEVTNSILSTIASTYAHDGVCPTSGKKCLSSTSVKRTMQLLFSCGMYDYSGQWAGTVGLPAKSGVAGAVFVVVPSICGISIWSPPLGKEGNSVRGLDFAEKLVEKKLWNIFDVITTKSY